MDISGAQTLLEMIKGFQMKSIDLVLCGVPKGTMEVMRQAGISEAAGEASFYWSVERALLDQRPRP